VRALGRCPARLAAGGLDGGGQKGGLKARLDAEVQAEVEALVGGPIGSEIDFEAIEVAVRRRVLGLAARAIERLLNADTSDHVGPALPCRSCAAEARYAGRHSKTIASVLGELRLERAYYHCAPCERGYCPRDLDLGIEGGSLSPGVVRMIGAVGALGSFAEGSQLLWELAGVQVDAKGVERTAEALGAEIDRDERSVVEAPARAEEIAPTLYLGMDGTGVPMRQSELVGRAGKQADGTAKTREVKLVTVWSAEGRDEEGRAVRDVGSVTYSAAIESAATGDTDAQVSEFAQRVVREAQRRGFERAGRRVVLGDGALWIWNLADEQFPGAVQIVDLFHAKGHVIDVAKAVYGPTSELGRSWAKARHDELDAGDVEAVEGALAVHAGACEEARKCAGYVARNRERMRYAQFRAQGLCVSTGVVEAGCKLAVGTRLKRAGMHWTVRGANSILALRCARLSGRFEDFWERRAQRRVA
jgi:hypothetical protein